MYDRELEEVGSRGALRMDRSGCTWEAAEINRKQKPIAVELMTSGMTTKEEQPDALNAMSRTWEDEMTGHHARSRRGIKLVIAQDVERVTDKPLDKV